MDSRTVKTAADARSLVEARGLSHVKLGVVDLDGVIRGKYMARDKFFSALESGFKFCDVIFGWDSADQLYDKSSSPDGTRHTPTRPVAYAARRPAVTSRSKRRHALFLGEFAGHAEPVCPRGTLRRVLDRAAAWVTPSALRRNSNSSFSTRRPTASGKRATAI